MAESYKKVIVADDHEVSVMLLSILLRRLGFDVITAKDGSQVMDIMKSVKPDLIFLDGHMPVMDGMATLKAIKSDDTLSDIPVILVTAHYDKQSHENYKKNGCFGYITKPVNVLKLNKLIHDAVPFHREKKRKHLRFHFNQKVQLTHEGKSEEYYAVMLSVGGIYLRTTAPLPVNTQVSISFLLGNTDLSLKGKVIYHKNVFGDLMSIDPGMAIEFNDIAERDSEVLEAYIAENLTWDLLDEQEDGSATIEL